MSDKLVNKKLTWIDMVVCVWDLEVCSSQNFKDESSWCQLMWAIQYGALIWL